MSRPKNLDLSQLAKRIVEEATGDAEKQSPPAPKSEAAVKRGRAGGLRGGPARKKALTEEELSKSALHAARARWAKD